MYLGNFAVKRAARKLLRRKLSNFVLERMREVQQALGNKNGMRK